MSGEWLALCMLEGRVSKGRRVKDNRKQTLLPPTPSLNMTNTASNHDREIHLNECLFTYNEAVRPSSENQFAENVTEDKLPHSLTST